jgi:hypothetical protein
MNKKLRNRLFVPSLFAVLLAMNLSLGTAQTDQTNQQVANAAVNTKPATTNAEPAPVFGDYRGVKIGMSVKEARASVEKYLKAKGDKQDFIVVSDGETGQIYYDNAGKVTAISIDYIGKSQAPTPVVVLGSEIEPRGDGSVYALKRYPAAGYWVSYNRTRGESPIVTITMQALQ